MDRPTRRADSRPRCKKRRVTAVGSRLTAIESIQAVRDERQTRALIQFLFLSLSLLVRKAQLTDGGGGVLIDGARERERERERGG